jgi:hypothetical protein
VGSNQPNIIWYISHATCWWDKVPAGGHWHLGGKEDEEEEEKGKKK